MATTEGLKKELPHLPKRTHMYEGGVAPPFLPGGMQDGKSLPQTDWRSDLNQLQLAQPAPQQEGQLTSRREHSQHGLVGHGMPWFEHGSKVQIPEGQQPPPMFTSKSRRSLTLTKRPSRVQKDMYRMNTGIDPVELLCTRLDSWRLAIKDLVAFFKNIHIVETKVSKGYCTATSAIHVPFRKSEGLFLESGGLQDVWVSVQNYAMERGVLHKEYSNYIGRAVLPRLRNIKTDIKQAISSIRHDRNLRTNSLYNSRMQVDKLVSKLDQNIKSTEQDPMGASRQTDPFLVNLDVIHSIKQLYTHENMLHEDVLRLQREVGVYEQSVILQTRATLQQLQDFCLQNNTESSEVMSKIMHTFDAIQPDKEWNEFVHRREGQLVAENSAYKTEGVMRYPNQNNALVHPGKIGTLQRRSGVMRQLTPGLFILTSAGYLHGYKSETQFKDKPCRPDLSLFVPTMTVSSASDIDQPFAFELRSTHRRKSHFGTEKSVFFVAQNEADYLAWFAALNKSTQKFEPQLRIDYSKRDLPGLPPPETATSQEANNEASRENDMAISDASSPAAAETSGLRRHSSKVETTDQPEHSSPDACQPADNDFAAQESDTGQAVPDHFDSPSFQSPVHSSLMQEQTAAH